jgi:lactate permease
MESLVAISPIVLLIYLMTKKKNVPSYIALPVVAILLYLLKILYFGSDFNLMNATVINGLLTAWTPILIIWGAIFLFRTMENTGGMDVVRRWVTGITDNPVAQLMIIGWAFVFLIEGASGFGTPVALAAPLLVGLGFKPAKAAIFGLMMDTIPVSFGGVGIPTWFGLGQLGLSQSQLLEIGFKTAIMNSIVALILPIAGLMIVVNWKAIKQNILFVYLSIFACVLPYLFISYFNYEFPTIVGGAIGLVLSIYFAKKQIGLKKAPPKNPAQRQHKIIKATFPLWGTILLLVITRIPELGIKSLITSTANMAIISLGYLGDFMINPALVVGLKNILNTDSQWMHQILYVPSIIPFFVIAFVTFGIYHSSGTTIKKTWLESWQKIQKPIIALLAALVFVKLLLVGGDQALTILIGTSLAELTGQYWQFFASYLGGLGSFFAGSNTVSNLTFGGIQLSIARTLDLNVTTILAAQSAGGAMGNMVCINNIVAACSVLGIMNKEGFILKRTFLPMVLYGVIVGLVSLVFSYS